MDVINVRLLKAILRSLDSLKTSLDKHVDAVSKRAESNDQSDNVYPPEFRRVEVNLPPEVTSYYRAEQSERPRKTVWSWIERSFAFLGLLAAITLGVLTYRTLREVRRQAESAHEQVMIMQRQLEATDRPWLKISMEIHHSISFDSTGQLFTYPTLVITNVGKSVAVGISLNYEMFLEGHFEPPTVALKRQHAICNNQITEPQPGEGVVLFPGESRFETVLGRITQRDVSDHSKNGFILPPVVAGCVVYDIPTIPGKHHQTGFIYQLGLKARSPLPIGFALGMIRVGKTARVADLDVRPWSVEGGDYAY